jgi:2-iminobutanoate/2-iminopropanoate deaminase
MLSTFFRNAVKLVCVGLAVGAFISLPAQQTQAQRAAARKYFNLPGRPVNAPFSDAVLAADTLYVAGHIGVNADGKVPADIDQEIKMLFSSFGDAVRAGGAKMDDLSYVTVYCTDLSLYQKFNDAYRAEFSKEFPARAFIGAGSLLLGGHFEMQGIAVRR